MNKKIVIMALLLSFAAPSLSFASTSDYSENATQENPTQVAFVQDVMKDVIKNTLYNLGTQVLNKYANPNNYNYNYSNQNSNTSSDVYYDYNNNTTSQYNTSGDFIPGQDPEPEPMIPIS
ncbi:MAG: hypothetical protein A2287_00230 [Candidatus Melainabacteria bacterium RIFOXYA12_FULL_32_12]|nr:MAG: hypothetical protein A2104_09685 [Candidatus Melainabacteria bacterium GWF2_32_7]OGI23063.1 MAG: hypothetical protein A2255_02930 [Candidatus Melainabacteria bacterium RIFOXYA2_FULL_32_9]OGI26033.1 MAG: hypothetical protein A2287_00230 [Candidatus Melainabacteria bacterium RIFOXYA12_FULL_32_12]